MKIISSLFLACVGWHSLTSHANADTIDQTTNPAPGVDWNQPNVWGGNPVVATNDYQTTANLDPASATTFIANSVTWTTTTNLRDAQDGSTFNGGRLILNLNTRLLGKATNFATSTADIVFNGGFISSAANTAGGSTLDGTITFGSTDIAAIGVIGANPGFTLNVTSKIVGEASDTLQLTNYGAGRTSRINLFGDISDFLGTLFLGNALEAPASGTFSIQSDAPAATVIMDTSTVNFFYELSGNVTFGALIIGGTQLPAGTYSFAELNTMAPGSFIDGGGSITVAVPEPASVSS